MRRLLFVLTVLAAFAASAQQDFSGVEVKATRVAGSVYMLTGAGGNIGVSVGADGIVVIDDQYAPLAPKIEAALKAITDKPVRFIINTHYHGDHTGGNEHFGKSAPIIAQENVRKRLQSGTTARGRTTPPRPDALPVLTFDDALSVHLNGEDIRAVHMPHGHTDGDAVVWFQKSNVVHMGDDLWIDIFPFVDLENGGSVRGLTANLDKILLVLPADAKVIPGHGTLSDKAGVVKFRDMLRATFEAVEQGVNAGKSLDQLKADKVLGKWDSWGQGFIKTDAWIDTLYQEVSASRTRVEKR